MKHHPYRLVFLLTIVVSCTCFALFVARMLQPAVVLPHFNLPHIALLCLLALLCEHYLSSGAADHPKLTALLSAAIFGLLPLCAGLVSRAFALRLALAGGITMAVMVFLFTSAMNRLRSAPCTPLAPPVTAFLLFLSVQAFTSIWL